MSQLSTSAINFGAKTLEKSSLWLYIQTGVYITMGHIKNKNIELQEDKMPCACNATLLYKLQPVNHCFTTVVELSWR